MRHAIARFSTLLLLLPLSACGVFDRGREDPGPRSPERYFPLEVGATWLYSEQDGDALKAYRVISTFDYEGQTWYQMTAANSGQVAPLWSRLLTYVNGDVLSRQSTSMSPASEPVPVDTILRSPIVVGDHWENQYDRRRVIAVDTTVTVPAGVFHDVVVVERTYGYGKVSRGAVLGSERLYYAPNVGMIRQEVMACIPCSWSLVDWE